MPSSSSPLSYAFAGALAGGRTSAAPAFVCEQLQSRGVVPHNRFLRGMQSNAVGTALRATNAIEFVADKLPMLPTRTMPLPLALRTVSGAVSGAALASADRRNALLGAALGAIGAIAGTFAMTTLRRGLMRRLHVPNALAGLAEEAALYGLRRIR